MAERAQSLFLNFTANENLSRGDLVYLDGPGQIKKALATSLATMPCMGIIEENVVSGDTVSVLVQGLFEEFTHGFLFELDLFISDTTAGALTSAAPAPPNIKQEVAQVLGPNTLLFVASPGFVDENNLDDEKVKITSNDTTTDYLKNKLSAGTGITITELNDGGNEQLSISAAGGTDTASNVNIGGEGVFKQKVGSNFEFKGINVNNNSNIMSLSADTPNNEIVLEVFNKNAKWNADHIQNELVTSATPTIDQIFKYDGTQWNLSELDLSATSLAVVQVRRTTIFSPTTSFTDMSFDVTDIENISACIEHNKTNTERIDIKETGLYLISFGTIVDFPSSGQVRARVFKNGTTKIPGSEIHDDNPSGQDTDVNMTVVASLVAGDYITIQLKNSTSGIDTEVLDTIANVVKLQGSKGAQGDVGAGSNIIIKDEGSNVTNTPHSELDFVGAGVSVTDGGSGKATVSIPNTGTDNDAIHDNVSGEINTITEKTTPVSADLIIIEDSAASNVKKKIQIGNLPGGGGGGITLKDEGIVVSGGPHDTLNFVSGVSQVINLSGGEATIKIGVKHQFFADQLSSPNTSNWAVNDFAPAAADPSNTALIVRLFDDSTEEGTGFMLRVDERATDLILRQVGKAKSTPPDTTKKVDYKLYFREITDQGTVGTWNSFQYNAFTFPASKDYVYTSQQETLATLGLTNDKVYQFEFTRQAGSTDDTLSGDYLLLQLELQFI